MDVLPVPGAHKANNRAVAFFGKDTHSQIFGERALSPAPGRSDPLPESVWRA